MKKSTVTLLMLLCIACVTSAHTIEDFFPGYSGADGFCLFPITSTTNATPVGLPDSTDAAGQQKTWEEYTATVKIGDQWYAKVGHGIPRRTPVSRKECEAWFSFASMVDLSACLTWEEYKAIRMTEQQEAAE